MKLRDPYQPQWPAKRRRYSASWPGPVGRYWRRGLREAVLVETISYAAALVAVTLVAGRASVSFLTTLSIIGGVNVTSMVRDGRRSGWPPPPPPPASPELKVAGWATAVVCADLLLLTRWSG